MGIIEGEGGGDGHLFWIMLGVGLNSSMDPDRDSSCWGLVLWEEVRLLVGLSGGGRGWSWVESGVGAWTGLAVGVGLNSKGEGLWLTDSILLIRGMHGVNESASLNWLFGVSCMLLMLSQPPPTVLTDKPIPQRRSMTSFLKLLHYTTRLRYALRSREIYTEEPITSLEILSEPPQTQDGQNFLHWLEARRFAHLWRAFSRVSTMK